MACGMSLDEIAVRLTELNPVNGRLRYFPMPDGVTLIDDTYSASLPSTMAALDTIKEIPAQNGL